MRWRYLILGMLLAVPTAIAIHNWPQRPAYRIPGGRAYLADDPTHNQLLFWCDKRKQGMPPVIERYDSETGHLASTVQLRLESVDPRLAMDHNSVISRDLSTIALLDPRMDENTRTIGMTGTIFDATSGKCISGPFDFGLFDRKGFSPDGRWFALIDEQGKLIVIDARTGRIRFESVPPIGRRVTSSVCFSPDSRHMLYQWQVNGESVRFLHLVTLESGTEEQSFPLPEGRILCEWRPNELRSYERLPQHEDQQPVRRYRHAFDGKTLGPEQHDDLLDCDYAVVFFFAKPGR